MTANLEEAEGKALAVRPHRRNTHYSGKFVLRLEPEVQEAAAIAAAAHGQSLNQWAVQAIREAAQAT